MDDVNSPRVNARFVWEANNMLQVAGNLWPLKD